jgi:nucleoside-diphosphate-sugar epimerase
MGNTRPIERAVRIFVAGATGVVGRRVVALLAGAGHEVTGMTRRAESAPGLRASGAEPIVCDVFDAVALADAVRRARPEVVVHELTDLAAGDRAANAAIRVQGTRNLVDAAHTAGVRRIVAQSIAWAYAPGDAPRPPTARAARPSPRWRRWSPPPPSFPIGPSCATACSTGATPGTHRTG